MSELATFAADDFRSVLCIVAHPDDLEYGVSAAVAAWTASGIEVSYLLLTRGEAGIDGIEPARTAVLRTEEQTRAAAIVGVEQLDFLDHPDGVLEPTIALRRDIARVVRARKPDAVLIPDWAIDTPYGLNHADHRVAGLAASDGVRDAGNRWVHTELLEEGLEPHAARWLLVSTDTGLTHGVEVTGEPLEKGIASLEAHAEYLAALPGHPAPRLLITGFTAMQGRLLGVPFAVGFKAYDFHATPPIFAEMMQAAAEAGA